MAQTLVYKILADHLADGELAAGREIGIHIDQTLTQDATGTTAFLLLEAMDVPRVQTDLSVSYVDHNLSQFGPENHADHLYLQSIAAKMGAHHSRPGNGICHQVHLERFARPGRTLLGSDSHTPTCGGVGMLAIGAGGLDVAVAMGGGAFYMPCPRVIGVELRGSLGPWVAPKDIILRLLSILTTHGNIGFAVEYFGEGAASLAVPARATCTNMGAELGVTTSIFPSDERVREFLAAQARADQYIPLAADRNAEYHRIEKHLHVEQDGATIENIRRYCTEVRVGQADPDGLAAVSFAGVVIDLGELVPLAAAPPSPGDVHTVSELAGKKVDQVIIGSCTNSSFQDLMLVAEVLKGRTVHQDVELGIAPGSRQVLEMLAGNGALASLIASGSRILECGCGPCIGQGFSPAEGALSLRTFNRNFAGRSGTKGDRVYLVSPATAVAAAVTGRITDPRELADELGIECPDISSPREYAVDDRMILPPVDEQQAAAAEVNRAASIVKPPAGQMLPDTLAGPVLIKLADNVSTDDIIPAGPFLKYRSNVPEYARCVFHRLNEGGQVSFCDRALAAQAAGKCGVIVAGLSYGQGSSREHAALCPMYLGVRAVIAKSIERIHQANLVNFAILPLTFAREQDYQAVEPDDELVIKQTTAAIASGDSVTVHNTTRSFEFTCNLDLTGRQRRILAAGGLLNYTRDQGQ